MYLTSLPVILSILGSTSEVLIDNQELIAAGNFGQYCPMSKSITMLESYPDQETHDNTIIHELVHALCRRIGIQLDHQTEEILAETLGILVSENFRLIPRDLEGEPSEDPKEETQVEPKDTHQVDTKKDQ